MRKAKAALEAAIVRAAPEDELAPLRAAHAAAEAAKAANLLARAGPPSVYAGATLQIHFQDPSKQQPVLLATFNVREIAQIKDAYQVDLGNAAMRPVLHHTVFAANIKRSKSKIYPDGQDGIFPGSYMRFVKRDGAWELDKHHVEFVRLGFSIKVVGEVAAK